MTSASDDRDFSLRLRGAYLTMHRRANARFARFGVTADQYVVLTALAHGQGSSQQDLVRYCHSDPNTVSALVSRLERNGLVTRRRDTSDGRARIVALTSAGRRLQRSLERFNAPFQAELEAIIAPEYREALLQCLDRIREAMGSPPVEPPTRRGRAARID